MHALAANLLWIIEILCLVLIAFALALFIGAITVAFGKAIVEGVQSARDKRRLRKWCRDESGKPPVVLPGYRDQPTQYGAWNPADGFPPMPESTPMPRAPRAMSEPPRKDTN